MYFDKEVGIVTLLAEIDKDDIKLDKVKKLIGEVFDLHGIINYQELVERVLIETKLGLNGEIYNGAYILSVIPGGYNTIKIIYLPPFPWSRYEHNKELFKIREEDVKNLMVRVLKLMTNFSDEQIDSLIGYSNI